MAHTFRSPWQDALRTDHHTSNRTLIPFFHCFVQLKCLLLLQLKCLLSLETLVLATPPVDSLTTQQQTTSKHGTDTSPWPFRPTPPPTNQPAPSPLSASPSSPPTNPTSFMSSWATAPEATTSTRTTLWAPTRNRTTDHHPLTIAPIAPGPQDG